MKVAVTGAAGLLGWHASVRLHARNCAARFKGDAPPIDLVRIDRVLLTDPDALAEALQGVDAILHFAGVNRAKPEDLETLNPEIAERLVSGCKAAGATPQIVYANTIHAGADNPYGRSKAMAGEILSNATKNWGAAFTNLILPHIFGEGARPRYNNVTATLIEALLEGQPPDINPEGQVNLLHAGAAAETAISAALDRKAGELQPDARKISVPDLWEKLQSFHTSYQAGIYPDLSDPFDLALFNCYRLPTYPTGWPRPLKLNTDPRGTLFEAAKSAGGGGQTFMSWTEPGVTRGEHFHLEKVERFLVVDGEAIIRIRKALGSEVWEYKVSGETPEPVDMPTLHTHSIENVGSKPMLALFWTHEIFDPAAPDTYADLVLQNLT